MSIELDADAARLASYLTFDGHLSADLKQFYLSSSDESALKDFARIVREKFGVEGKTEEGMGHGKSWKYRVLRSHPAQELYRLGVPRGNKTKSEFRVPKWVSESRANATAYLQTAFDCEGSVSIKGKQADLRFSLAKDVRLMENGLAFLEDLKRLLSLFGVACTNTWLVPGNKKKDGSETAFMNFRVKQKSNDLFYQNVGFGNSLKQVRLQELLGYPC